MSWFAFKLSSVQRSMNVEGFDGKQRKNLISRHTLEMTYEQKILVRSLTYFRKEFVCTEYMSTSLPYC